MAPSLVQQTCTGRTCLKWSADGSLSEHDHDELMKRLCSSDPVLAKSQACNFPQKVDLTGYESPQMKRYIRSEGASHEVDHY